MSSVAFLLVVLGILGIPLLQTLVLAMITVVPNSQTVVEGDDVTINCNVSMNSTNLNLTWNKADDQRLLSHSYQLMLPNINETDAGKYICSASNGSTSWKAVATIIVTTSPVITANPRIQTVVEGEDVTVNCEISGNATNMNFTWSRFGYHRILSNASQLSLPSINRSQEGSYNCSVTNGTNQWTTVATIIVNYPVQILSITANQTVNESSTASFSCHVGGSPTPFITWSFPNGRKIWLRRNGSFVITNISRTGNGKYVCRASNGIGSATSASTFLNVQYKPTVLKSWHKEPIASWIFHKTTLNCSGDGNPVPEITWSKDGSTLKKQPKFQSIDVSPSKEDDFGIYVCIAENPLGKSRIEVEVKRTAFPPSAPEIQNAETTLQNRSFVLQWSEPSSNGRPILRYVIWLRNISLQSSNPQKSWNRITAGNVTAYTLYLDWGTSYQVAVIAENDQGSSKQKRFKNFTVVPDPTSETCAPPSPPVDGSPPSFIFGLVVGVTAFLVVSVIFIGYCTCKRRTRRGDIQPRTAHVDGKSPLCSVAMKDLSKTNLKSVVTTREDKHLYVSEHPIYVNASFCEDVKDDWEFPRKKLHIQKQIGKGAFCVVARAFAEGLGTVAVKMPKETALESNKRDLLEEYYLLRQIEPHPNVIRLMGAVTCSDPIMVMFEYIPYGDLLGYLRRSRGLHDNYYKDPDVQPTSSLTSEQLLRFAREIADGMAFISSNKIIHRDLAARNVLVGEGEICKITDFGMARDVQLNEIYQKRSKGRLPVKWTAYESLLYGFSTTQSDVWSYGIVLYEIFTIGGCPYPNVKSHEIAYKIQKGYRMPKPAHVDNDIYALMSECWKTEPELRPTFDSISKIIKRLEHSHKNIIYMNVYDERLYGNVGDWD